MWSFDETESQDGEKLKTFKVKRKHELLFTEQKNRAEWGELDFTGPSDVKHECGTSGRVRQYFSRKGKLQNEIDTEFRSIMDDEPIFAFSKSFDLKSNHSGHSEQSSVSEDSVLFTIAHIQDR